MTETQDLRVLVLEAGKRCLPWERLVSVMPLAIDRAPNPRELATRLLDSLASDDGIVIDLTGASDVGRSAQDTVEALSSADAVSRPYWVCRPEAFADLSARVGPRSRLQAAVPLLYAPAVLESRRLLASGTIGELERLDVTITGGDSQPAEVDILLSVTALFFLGPVDTVDHVAIRSSRRCIAKRDAAVASLTSAPGTAGEPSATGCAVGTDGSLRFDTTDSLLGVESMGRSLRMPLPEGSGSYYCMEEVVELVRGRGRGPSLVPGALVRDAINRFARED